MDKTWTSVEDNQPDRTVALGLEADFIVELKKAVRERIAQEHDFDLENQDEQGVHRMGSARVWVSETVPAEVPGPADTEQGVEVGRVWFKPSTQQLFVRKGTGWFDTRMTARSMVMALLALSEKTSLNYSDKVMVIDVAGGNVGRLVSMATMQTAVLSGIPWADSAGEVKADGNASVGSVLKVARVDHVHPKGDANTVQGHPAADFATASQGTVAEQAQSLASQANSAAAAAQASATAAQATADAALPASEFNAGTVVSLVNGQTISPANVNDYAVATSESSPLLTLNIGPNQTVTLKVKKPLTVLFDNNGDGNLRVFLFGHDMTTYQVMMLNPGIYTIYSKHEGSGGGVIKVLGVYGAVGAGNPGDIWEVV